MNAGATMANAAWAAASLPAWRRFRGALSDPAVAQQRVLDRCLRAGRGTAFGREFELASVSSIRQFQDRVPVMTADDLAPWTQRIVAGEADVLTRHRVTRLVPSSGTTAAVKLLPYTAALHAELSAGVGAWIAELFRCRPSLMAGSAYWSVTPAVGDARPFVENEGVEDLAASAVPIGFDDDAAYLGGVCGALARRVLAVPSSVRWQTDLAAFRDETLTHMLLARDLRLVSVWHPSFLTGLLDALIARWDRLLERVACADRRRAVELAGADPDDMRSVWPHLGLVSCWTDGPAAGPARTLVRRLHGIEVQPKGLLATEGVVTIPFAGRHPVALTSHFFEFVDDGGRARLAHELEDGVDYGVLLTTGGGLWRYRLGDCVRVDGRIGATPSLRFIGRDDSVSDLVGEKLSDAFVAGVIERLFAGERRPEFAMLAPESSGDGGVPGYVLWLGPENPAGRGLAAHLERELRRNPHYAWAVDLGQLAPARVAAAEPGAHAAYIASRRRAGQRLGSIKPASLTNQPGSFETVFCNRR